MAEPDSPDSLPTQPWLGPIDPGPAAGSHPRPPAPSDPNPRRGGWQPPDPLQLQASFPQYEIRGILGRGGMGAVYQGWQKSLRRLVAIKILPPGLEDNGANFAERFQREAQAMARFSHPGIVSVFDAGETPEGLFYFAMEYIEGTDVQQMVKTQGLLTPEHALSITAHVCDALAYAHKRGVIHRDIKPSNIMVDREGQVKVADFGLAKVESDDSGALVTGTSVSMGTPDFMAPEALYGMGRVDHRADLYAVGVMLYQMLTGELPRGMFEMPSIHRAGVDPRFDAIVARAMQKDPDKRYASATEIRTDLDKIVAAPIPHRSAVQEAPPPSPPPRVSIRAESTAPAAMAATRKIATSPESVTRRTGRWLWLSSGIAATLLVVGGGAIFFHDKPRTHDTQAGASPPDSVSAPITDVPPLDVAAAAAPPLDNLPVAILPSSGWKPVISDPNEVATQKGVTLVPNGWVRLNGAYLRVPRARDLALRARLRFNGVESWGLKVRERGPNAEEAYTTAVAANGTTLILAMRDAANPGVKTLTTAQLPRTLSLGQEYDLALAAQGRELTVYFDSQPLIRWHDAALTGDEASIGSNNTMEFKDAQWLPLASTAAQAGVGRASAPIPAPTIFAATKEVRNKDGKPF